MISELVRKKITSKILWTIDKEKKEEKMEDWEISERIRWISKLILTNSLRRVRSLLEAYRLKFNYKVFVLYTLHEKNKVYLSSVLVQYCEGKKACVYIWYMPLFILFSNPAEY